jgi:hypothetical protein
LSLWAHLRRSPPAIQTSTRPSRPVLLTRRHSGEQRASPLLDASRSPPRSCQRRSRFSTAPGGISRPTPAARPTTPRRRHRLACRQFLLGMRAGCGAERPAGGRVRQRDRCTPGRACPAGSVRRSTAELRSGRAPAPRRTCRQPTVRKVRRHRNRPAIGGKGVGTVDGRVVACAPWGAVFGVGHVHRGSA